MAVRNKKKTRDNFLGYHIIFDGDGSAHSDFSYRWLI
jgi:hypothetical protein